VGILNYRGLNMDIDWQTIIETAIGSGAGAVIILLISNCRDNRREVKRNFNDAILIQMDLHKMLGASLKVKEHNEMMQVYNQDMKIISFKWMLTQFLTYHRGKTRSIVKNLEDAKISYQKLEMNVHLRKTSSKIANDYAESVDYAIEACFKAFRALYDHIEDTYHPATPVKLGYGSDTVKTLEKQFTLSDAEKKKYFEQM
jgi:hypothetical protein